MAGINDTLLIRKTKNGGAQTSVISTLARWNIVCISFPFEIGGETKEPYNNDWKDEHGEDTYIPDVLKMKAYDVKANFAYKGSIGTAYMQIKSFKEYLNGKDNNGASLEIYHPRTGIGRQKCYMKSFADTDFTRSNIDDVLSFSVTFRVTDPDTDVTLSLPSNG